jgi:hypothetical protein
MADKDILKAMLDNLVDGKPEQAQIAFHQYVKDKIQDVYRKTEAPVQADDNNNAE